MKRFVFRYQTVLEVREQAQKHEEGILATLFVRQRTEVETKERLLHEEATLREAWSGQMAGRLDLDSLLTMHASLDGLGRRIDEQNRAIELAEARCDNQREIVTRAMQEAEVLRQLKARDFDTWRRALDQAEAAALDELATLRYTRR